MSTRNNFPSVAVLREILLENNNQLKILHPQKSWVASFTWAEPVSLASVRMIEKQMGRQFPEDYINFLVAVSNGATLYYDAHYGQWGYKIYGIDNITESQTRWESIFQEEWMPNFLAVGEIIDESHPLIMNLKKPTKDKQSCEILDGNPLDSPSDWYKMSRSFHEWLENLITAQGAKYWLWM